MTSIRAEHNTAGFYVLTPVIYGATHNYGRGPIPMRKFIPDASRLPREWRASYVTILRSERVKALGR